MLVQALRTKEQSVIRLLIELDFVPALGTAALAAPLALGAESAAFHRDWRGQDLALGAPASSESESGRIGRVTLVHVIIWPGCSGRKYARVLFCVIWSVSKLRSTSPVVRY